MAGKVIHVSDDVHAKVKAFCDQNKLRSKDWVEALVLRAIDADMFDPQNVVIGQLASLKVTPAVDPDTVKKLRAEIKSLRFKLDREKDRHQPVLAPVEQKPAVQLPRAKEDESIYSQDPFWKRRRDADQRRADAGRESGAPVCDAHDVPGDA